MKLYRDKLTPYWPCYSQYHFSIWLLNCNAYSDISSVCQTRWRLATVASHVACSNQDAAIWLVEVPLAANSRKGELENPETKMGGLETQPLSPKILRQCCARLLVAASRVIIRHVVSWGNTYWTIFSETRIRGWVSKHNKWYVIRSRIICRLQ